MKIISKYKDYYDYLSGIYGIDEKLVLDRRQRDDYTPINGEKVVLHIADYIIEGYYKDGKFYYGNDIKQFADESKYRSYWPSMHHKRDYDKSVYIHKERWQGFWIYTEIVPDVENTNTKIDCPIFLEDTNYYRYPILSELKLPSFLPADDIYKMLSAWLSYRITAREQTPERTDKQIITSKGFDNKRSFRPKMKK